MKVRRVNGGRPGRGAAPFVVIAVLFCGAGVGNEPELYPLTGPSAAEVADRRLVGLRALGFFDPRIVQPDFDRVIPAGPRMPVERTHGIRYFLIQFTGAVTASLQTRLEYAGLRVVGYVPHNALVVGVPQDDALDALRSSPGLRYLGPFLPGYKLDPDLFRLLGDEPAEGAPRVAIDVEWFPGETPDALLRWVARRFSSERVRVDFVRRGDAAWPSHGTFEVDPRSLRPLVGAILHAPEVAYVTRRTPLRLYNDDAVWIGQSYDRLNGPDEARVGDPKPYTDSATIWNRGLLGTGQIIAVADTGLEYETCFWQDPLDPLVPQQVTPPAPLTLNPDHRKIVALNGVNTVTLDHDDSFRHGTHVAATAAGDDLAHLADEASAGHDHGDGMAPEARIVFEDIGGFPNDSCSTNLSVASILDLLEQEYDAGARISSNSWGANDDRPDEVDAFVWAHEEFLVLLSAGNQGTGGVNELAQNKNAVAVGATENYDPDFVDPFGTLDPENMTAFSSVGPAFDGRVKPDVAAPGYVVYSNRFPVEYQSDEAECDPGDPTIEVCFLGVGGCYLTHTSEDCSVQGLLGTSMATPAVAGLAALARQYFVDGFYPTGQAKRADARTPSAALLKAVLINGARNMTGHRYERRPGSQQDFGALADAPSAVQGWGRVTLDDALFFDGDDRGSILLDVAHADGLATGESVALQFAVTSAAQPVKLTLVWSDPPAQSYASRALVNDLDLELGAPGGTHYRGNQWTEDDPLVPGDKVSLPDAPGRDASNNVEVVWLPDPEPGLYTMSVEAVDVPGYHGVFTQGFAVVVTGAVTTSPGAVIDPPLRIDAEEGSGQITLTWGASCLPTATDYEIYEGNLGDFTSHTPRFCSTAGATTRTFDPRAADAYYLVVPRNADQEGSYGTGPQGDERPQSGAACLPRRTGPCS